ncbi:hypothetical protein ABC383_21200 [Noviherbaspirillum sp. 1P10PC]|uniref:hypothetical protein n=1 Tax=Noviherbaspirillum sp. 1P10PC TaxID=3132292 RepID=UPI00399FC662
MIDRSPKRDGGDYSPPSRFAFIRLRYQLGADVAEANVAWVERRECESIPLQVLCKISAMRGMSVKP